MNRFHVNLDRETDFERIWKERQSYLEEVPGFMQFALLRSEDAGNYISYSTWTNREAFITWTQSEAFARGHAQGSLKGILTDAPQLNLFSAIIEEDASGRRIDNRQPASHRRMTLPGH
jgi:heme-degrading monooxygenase HmoA